MTPKDATVVGHQSCLSAAGREQAEIAAPVIPGVYTVRYVTSVGTTLAHSDIEIFEILATISAPAEVAPQDEISVAWTGPGADQDFVAVARLDSPPLKYIHWAPVSGGNPVRLRTPYGVGDFELRYIRAADGTILARAPLRVATEQISMQVPQKVDAGTRFEVHWDGTPGENDVIAVAEIDSDDRTHLDWSYVSSGNPVTLAAPFEPGLYVVRYLGGENLTVRDRRRFRVY